MAIICVSSVRRSAGAFRAARPQKMSSKGRRTIAIDQTQIQPDKTAVADALTVLDRFMAALNTGNEPALLATLHFPHYRLAGGRMRVWDPLDPILAIFSPVPVQTGTTVNGIFAELSPPERPRCTWTCNSPAIAPTIR